VSNILHMELVREDSSVDLSVDFAALTLKSREKSTTFQLQFLKRNLNLLSDFPAYVLAHNFAIPISGGK
jgi:galactose-1-phosphate uridylyltransferase